MGKRGQEPEGRSWCGGKVDTFTIRIQLSESRHGGKTTVRAQDIRALAWTLIAARTAPHPQACPVPSLFRRNTHPKSFRAMLARLLLPLLCAAGAGASTATYATVQTDAGDRVFDGIGGLRCVCGASAGDRVSGLAAPPFGFPPFFSFTSSVWLKKRWLAQKHERMREISAVAQLSLRSFKIPVPLPHLRRRRACLVSSYCLLTSMRVAAVPGSAPRACPSFLSSMLTFRFDVAV